LYFLQGAFLLTDISEIKAGLGLASFRYVTTITSVLVLNRLPFAFVVAWDHLFVCYRYSPCNDLPC